MRSLWRIGSRYMLTAVLVTVLLVAANFVVLFYWGYRMVGMEDGSRVLFGREKMDAAAAEITLEEGEYRMSPEGYGILKESSFAWVMLVDREGDVVWSHELPPEIPLHYELTDIAALSRWYLKDYPVGVWKNPFGLMVYGYDKERFARFSLVSDLQILDSLFAYIRTAFLLNVILLLALVLILAWRFYRSLKPVEQGIVKLSGGETVELQERGSVRELARRLNQTSAALREKDEKLKRRDDARTDWIAGVSHDIRTPLALICGYSDELMHDERIPGESRWKAEAIRQQSMVLKELVENLNLTSKLEYHSQPLDKTTFSPAALLRECVAEYYNQGLRDSYEIHVSVQKEAEKALVCADRGLLLRLFRNLIGNSIRHNPKGCGVTVALDSRGDIVRCRFSDTGSGIPKEIVEAMGGTKEKERAADGREDRAGEPGAEETEAGLKRAQPHIMGLRIASQIAAAHGGALLFVRRDCGSYDIMLELQIAD
ncbi:MAG: HAMP domain-containing histidine kinase [Eubacterium sp.]|nr:HAMP domain-containing histidine kinase [Eubacterium sp.]MCM1303883.1 HAMP domain-containing histidine kinase [Butyrivibrio sp.]MCM1344842.1 HAMP domain-containing histidine kinase [Muribaculaceae bacterium]MCM1410815.1 HAMP domain-containing histidine kinase [Lachnospiraceae bacterium]